ncbi:MAG TPA: CHC2 zinc finger domain-containing protein, partial [Burkholderiales bacterium]|nr:CHC2 zinc finger domain-containing protein [Burkholderiales bacterium]
MAIDVQSLKAKADIVSVIGHYVPLKKRGSEYVGICQFHDDKSPSMWVVPQKGIYHCFSCGASGDVLDFLQHVESCDFKAAVEKLAGPQEWKPRAPVKGSAPKPERITSKPPPDAGTPEMTMRALGDPVKVWVYRDTDGGPLFYVARYETEGKKEIRCWSWGTRGDEPPSWGCGHYQKPRPLFALDRMAANPKSPILIVEGEKAAEAAQALLPDYVVTTWPGGAQAWRHADLNPLKGRRVDLWPDADEPGREAMAKLAGILADKRGLACTGKMIDTSDQPEGFDAADWQGTDILAWLRARATPYMVPEAIPEDPPETPQDESPPLEAYEADPPPQDAPSAPVAKPKRKPRLQVVGSTALAPDPDADPLPAAMSEDALADHFAAEHGARWRYVKAWGAWFEWRSDGWYRDDTAMVDRLAVQITREALYWAEAQLLTPDGKRRVNSKRTAGNLRDIAMSDRRIAATVDQWDKHPMLLGVPGGVVNLETGKLSAPRPELYITKRTHVAPEPGECP